MNESPLWVQALLDRGLSATEFRLLSYIVWRQGKHTKAWPSQKTIARDLGLSVQGVRNVTRRLQGKGWLEIAWPGGPGRSHACEYAVKTPQKVNRGLPFTGQKRSTAVEVFPPEKVNGQSDKRSTVVDPNTVRRTLSSSAQADTITFDWTTFTFTGIPEDLLHQWAGAYPTIDVDGEIRRAAAWCRTNERKARARSDWSRFLGNWLSKSQRDAEAAGQRQEEPQPAEDWTPTPEELEERKRAWQAAGGCV